MSSIHGIKPAISLDEMQDEHATIFSSVNEKQNSSVPTILPDEVVYASNEDAKTDHEYQLKCNDPENGVNKQTSTVDSDLDGGYGWLVIIGTFMVQVTSFGTASCW
ncbi:hypothetical protein BD408DRAFT_436117 [Parasitella parasitica]|nr:hypothetical protein BD408DRAFT_436117 [Parasitella parasitica]